MPREFGAGLERISLVAQNFGDALGGEIHVDEAGASIGDLAIVGVRAKLRLMNGCREPNA